jgi:Tol biopolymer transport system component/DNA-binding winged helix-turn-helix (wHTH) protein
MSNDVPGRVRFGAYEVDLHTREFWKHGLRLKLVGQPFEILAVLLARPGELVTREELRAQLWPGDTFVDFNHGLNAAVNKLREALSDSADQPRYIETLPRRGYRFMATVERAAPVQQGKSTAAEPSSVAGAIPQGTSKQPVIVPQPAFAAAPSILRNSEKEPLPPRSWRRILLAAGSTLVIVFMIVVWLSLSPGPRETSGTAQARAVLVSPLTNLPEPTSDPAFSPDGTRIAFRRSGYSARTSGIFVKAIGGADLLQLTNDSADCCPAWSPSGRSIAFSRLSDKEHTIYEVSSTGGALRKLFSGGASKRGDLDWSPDGSSIAFVGETEGGASSIFLLSPRDLSFRRITQPPLLNKDWGPAFSPDGQSLAFIRTRETGLPETIVVMPAAGGELRVLHEHYNGLVGPPAWTADSQAILFATGPPALFRIPASGGNLSEITAAATPAWRPAASRRGYRLAYQKISSAMSVWQMDLSRSAGPRAHGLVVTDNGRNEGAQVSPDGKKLAFMSNRSGSMEIWVSDPDGSNAIQMTAMGGTGSPRWSPDSRSIAFDSNYQQEGTIFVVNVEGGTPRPLVQGESSNLVPSWSRDGKWVYFASDRSGGWQVWKVQAEGGSPVQVTAHGGFAAYESRDGKVVYYSKFNMPNPEVWKMPVKGGVETRVSSLVRPETWADWSLVSRGIFFVAEDVAGDPSLMFFDFASGDVTRRAGFDKRPFWLSASPDGKSVLFEHLDQENSHVMLVENFH